MGGLVDDVAREALPRELVERLGPSLDRQAAVLRIKQLNVALRLAPEDLERGRLTAAWATALARALHEALARPDGDGELLRRFESRAAYVAAAIAFLLRGPPGGKPWHFPELEAKARLPTAIAVLEILLELRARCSATCWKSSIAPAISIARSGCSTKSPWNASCAPSPSPSVARAR